MIGQGTDCPAMPLPERHACWTDTPFFRTEKPIGCGGNTENRTDAPNKAVDRLCGRKEQALRDVSKAELSARAREDVFLIDHRQNCPRNQVPVLVEMEGNDRLKVQVGL